MENNYENLYRWFVWGSFLLMMVMIIVSNLIVKKYYRVETKWGWQKKYIYLGDGKLIPFSFIVSISVGTISGFLGVCLALFGKIIMVGVK